MAFCKRCKIYRPGLNSKGMCRACVSFDNTSHNSEQRPAHSSTAQRSALSESVTSPISGWREIGPNPNGLWDCPRCKRPTATLKGSPCYSCGDHNERRQSSTSHLEKCPRCRGSGHIAAYSHVEGGQCYYCKGKGTVSRLKAAEYSPTPTQSRPPDPFLAATARPTSLTLLSRERFIDAALNDALSYSELRSAITAAESYGFSKEDLELLHYCAEKKRPVRPAPHLSYRNVDW